MKFKLNEKYILKENNFILNERFILQEETAEEIIITAVDKVITRITDILNVINSDKTNYTANKEINEKLADIVDEINLADDQANVKAKAVEYLNTFKTAVGKELNLKPELNNKIKYINSLIQPIDKKVSNSAITNIKKEITDFNTLVQEATLLKTDNSAQEELIKSLATTNEYLEKIKTRANLVTNDTKEALQTKTDLQTLYKALPAKSNVKPENWANIEKTCDNFIQSPAVKTIIETEEREAAKAAEDAKNAADAAEIKNSEKKDWAELYKNVGKPGSRYSDYPKFWNDYYKTEWGKDANHVREFGKAFENELDTLGFDSINNPFIKFLQEKDDTGKRRATIVPKELYATFHNAAVHNLLTTDDIRGEGKLGKLNLIFNDNLFNQSGNNFTEYLRAQKRILDYSNRLVKDEEELPIVVQNILLAKGDLKNILNPSINTEPNRTLRPLTAINQTLTQLLGNTNDKKEIDTDGYLKYLDARNIDKNTAKNMLSFLSAIYLESADKIITELMTKIPELNSTIKATNTDINDYHRYYDELKLGQYKLNTNQVKKLFIYLAEKAGIYTPKKEAN